ncbi:MAG: ABC transporter permease [Gemmatimonadetes bacterium]|nr:ABC transporter permease [Gemmatimonadota bacterium]
MFATVISDLRLGLRLTRKTPGLSAAAILTIALGVGLVTQTYSTVDGSVIRGLNVPGADRLVHVNERIPSLDRTNDQMPLRVFLDLRRQQTVFEDVAAGYESSFNLAGEGAPPERVRGDVESANALALIGVPPLMGRVFRQGEDATDAPPRIVLSHRLWKNRFAGDPAVVGKTIRVNGEATEIIGVMPEGFRFPFDEDAWMTLRLDPATMSRDAWRVDVFAKVRGGVTPKAVSSDLEEVARWMGNTYPTDAQPSTFFTEPYAERYMPRQIADVLFLMLAATFGVLLIACANVANLLLARATVRSREVAVRTALGANRVRVVRQLFSEALVLAILGGVLGGVLAWVGAVAMDRAIVDIEKPYWIMVRMDGTALAFAIGMTLLASVAAGTIPAIRASGMQVGELLKDEGRGSSSLRVSRISAALVVGQIAVSGGLLLAAGLMVKSLTNLRKVDLGFEPQGVLTGRVTLPRADYPTAADRRRFFRELEDRLQAEPGVESSTLASTLPSLGASRWALSVEGESYPQERDHPIANGAVVTDGFFRTMKVSVLRGRDFQPGEVWDPSDPVAIVNQSCARKIFGGRDPLGRRVRLGGSASSFPWVRIVGIVPDIHIGGGVGGIGDDRVPPEEIYLPPAAYDVQSMAAAVRTRGAPDAMAPRLRAVVSSLDPNLPVYGLESMPRAIESATWFFGLFGSLFAIFGIAALFMAAVGLYGVMAFSVNQRRHEVGVRMALGAGPREIMHMVLRRGAGQVGLGLLLGLGLGMLMARPLSVVTFGVRLGDPAVYLIVVGTLIAVGILACVIPGRSAARTDPVEAIRT